MTKYQQNVDRRLKERTAKLTGADKQLTQKIEHRQRMEEALHVERQNFISILESMREGAFIVNQNLDIEYTNPVIEKNFGPVQGRKCHDYFNDKIKICPWCKLREVFAGKSFSWRWNSSKTDKTYDVIETPISNTLGIISKLTIIYDITNFKKTEKALQESENQLRNLSFQLLTAQETERRRIARELHDELGGALAVLKLRTSFIEKRLKPDQTEIKEECKQNLLYIDQIIDSVHRLSHDLSPSILDDLGLTPAIRWLIDNFIKYSGINVASDIANVDHLLPKESHIEIYRTFQEVFANIGKHAQAGNVAVKVRIEEASISFLIEDDGRGFDGEAQIAKAVSKKSLGLASIKERAKMLGGSFNLWSEQGRGTRITLSIPI